MNESVLTSLLHTIPSSLSTKVFLVLLLIFGLKSLKSQEIDKNYELGDKIIHSKEAAVADSLFNEIIVQIILDEINMILEHRGFDIKTENPLLKKAAVDQASYMALTETDLLTRKEKGKQNTGERIAFYGGSKNGVELSSKTAIGKGNTHFSYAKIADEMVFRWFANSKKAELIEKNHFNLVGVGAMLDKEKRKVYVSLVLGNYKSLNQGADLINELSVPYPTKNYGLEPPTAANCKNINRLQHLSNLHSNLKVEGNTIYFETDDIRPLNKLLREKKDGLAVDILLNEQFQCNGPNRIDYNKLTKGILTKRIYTKKLFNNNLADLNASKQALKTPLAELPENIPDGYELGLVLIQNKSVCKTATQSFIIQPSGHYQKEVSVLADTISINSRFNYKPVSDTLMLTFKVPFENRKFTYEPSDIEPFLNALNEPKFTILAIKITAYSSVEGTDEENRILQQKRAESIVAALESMQKSSITTQLITDYNWIDFSNDIKNTAYHKLTSMPLDVLQTYIRENKLKKKLEPILKNHRFASIEMTITYDLSGDNEAPFVIRKFNQALEENDRALALSIQKYIIKQVLNYRYAPTVLTQLIIPNEPDLAGMLMNNCWLQHVTQQITASEFQQMVQELHQLNPQNEYIAFNHLFFKALKSPIDEKNNPNTLQTSIDRLYFTPLKKSTVDALNLKYQFKLLQYFDSTNTDSKTKEACINRIKQLVDIKAESMENTLRLAELFIENNDLDFALKTLSPWITNPASNESIYFTYVSLCSHFEEQMHTQQFNYAMQKAYELNPQRFCELFNGSFFSLTVFENDFIKKAYCNYCNERNTDE